MFKLFTLNLNGAKDTYGAWETRKELILKELREIPPDVLVLQAVVRDPRRWKGRDQATQLLADLKRPGVVHYEAGTMLSTGETEGSAMLAFVPELQFDKKLLALSPSCEDKTIRLVLKGEYAVGDSNVAVYNCHFSWVQTENLKNITTASGFLSDPRGQPAVIAGDFNATNDQPGPQFLFEKGWLDAWHLVHPQAPGYTFESRSPEMRIDYVLLSPSLAERLEDVQIVGEKSMSGKTGISDHFGLLLTLDI